MGGSEEEGEGGDWGLGFTCRELEVNDEKQLELWRKDCKKAFQIKECEDGEKYSSGQTFWVGATDEPRCELERLAKGIFELHTKNKEFDSSTSGAEWWTQYIDEIDDIGFHFDRDYGLEEVGDLRHPHLGTVTYLSSIGGATVILDMPGKDYPTTATGEIYCPLSKCIISRPAVGKHITFDGRLLHGAPADLYDTGTEPSSSDDSDSEEDEGDDSEQKPRVTFLVNIWLNHVPTQAEPLDEEAMMEMEKPLLDSSSAMKNVTCSRYSTEAVQSICLDNANERHESRWTLEIEDEQCVICMALPPQPQLEKTFDTGTHTVIVDYCNKDGSVLSTVRCFGMTNNDQHKGCSSNEVNVNQCGLHSDDQDRKKRRICDDS